VILIAFLLQKWLHERASTLRYITLHYLACNVFPSTPGLLRRPFPSRFPS
jgi:hypothetical protein